MSDVKDTVMEDVQIPKDVGLLQESAPPGGDKRDFINVKAEQNTQNNDKKKNKQNKKQNKKQQTVPKAIPRQDHFIRLSYLYQLGNLEAFKKHTSNEKIPSREILSRSYIRAMDIVSKKTVLKLSTNIKRTICKGCQRLLNDPQNCETRITNTSNKKDPKFDMLEVKCIKCDKIKRFAIGLNRNYIPFSEREDILHEPGDPVKDSVN